jgi:hypothetical protein
MTEQATSSAPAPDPNPTVRGEPPAPEPIPEPPDPNPTVVGDPPAPEPQPTQAPPVPVQPEREPPLERPKPRTEEEVEQEIPRTLRYRLPGDRTIYEVPLNPHRLTLGEQAEAERVCGKPFYEIDFDSKQFMLFLLKAGVARVNPRQAARVEHFTDDDVEVLDDDPPTRATSPAGGQS